MKRVVCKKIGQQKVHFVFFSWYSADCHNDVVIAARTLTNRVTLSLTVRQSVCVFAKCILKCRPMSQSKSKEKKAIVLFRKRCGFQAPFLQ